MPLNIEPLEPRSVHNSAAELGCGALAIFAAIDFYSTLVILVGGFSILAAVVLLTQLGLIAIWLVFATISLPERLLVAIGLLVVAAFR